MIDKIRKYGDLFIWTAVVIEMILWASLENLIGCGMTLICWYVFRKIGLNEKTIKEHIFGWLVFLSMSLYRILPLLATMFEFHSIGYNFINPIETYLGETLLYLVSALAFYIAISKKYSLLGLKDLLYRSGFYARVSNKAIWAFGMFGLIVRFYLMYAHVQIGDIIGKTLVGFSFLQYAPLLLFFPSLYSNNTCGIIVKSRGGLWYLIFIVILAFATNSRYAILEPFGTFVLLLFLSYLQYPIEMRKRINKKNILLGVLAVIFIVPFLSDVSLAMLANRGIRENVSVAELFSSTISTYLDRDKMEQLRRLKEGEGLDASNNYREDWSETYVNNFALNRYCNMRVSDNTLYHAKKIGFGNEKMYDDFWNEIMALCPMPILKLFGITYNKTERYSRGDKLKAMSMGSSPFASNLVTSHLADGLLTFGYPYFIIEGILFYLRFLFLDTFLIRRKKETIYSMFGLITIFSFLAMFRNAGGACDSLSYLLRGYWQDVILYLISFALLRRFVGR